MTTYLEAHKTIDTPNNLTCNLNTSNSLLKVSEGCTLLSASTSLQQMPAGRGSIQRARLDPPRGPQA